MFIGWIIGCIIAIPFTTFCLWLGDKIMWKVPLLHGPVFIPSTDISTELMLKLAKLHSREKLADLGSGDGKIVIAAALKGARSDGFENSPTLVYQSRRKIKKLGLSNKAHVYLKSFWSVDLSQYDVVTLYTSAFIMPKHIG